MPVIDLGPLLGLKLNIANMAVKSDFKRRLGATWHNNWS